MEPEQALSSLLPPLAGPETRHRPVRGPERWTQPHLPAGGSLRRDTGERRRPSDTETTQCPSSSVFIRSHICSRSW